MSVDMREDDIVQAWIKKRVHEKHGWCHSISCQRRRRDPCPFLISINWIPWPIQRLLSNNFVVLWLF
jgi:hypothetical protein